jgi:hypothetical protein
VGGVSGRPITGTGGAILRSSRSWRWKAPGSQEAITLRGALADGEPRPVRSRSSGPPTRRAVAPATTGRPEVAEKGNVVGARHQAHAPDATRPKASARTGTRPLLGPRTRARRTSHTRSAKAERGGARRPASRSGKPLAREEEPTPGLAIVDDARLAARHRSLKRSRVMRQKRKPVAAGVPARKREPWSKCPYVVCSLQKSVGAFRPRIRSRAALRKGWRRE